MGWISQIITGVVCTVLGTLIATWLLAPDDTIPLSATVQFLQVSAPLPYVPREDIIKLAEEAEKVLPITGAKAFLQKADNTTRYSIYVIRVKNVGESKQKNIEVLVENAMFISLQESPTTTNNQKLDLNSRSGIQIPFLNPSDEISVFAIADADFYIGDVRVRILADGRVVPFEITTPERSYDATLGVAKYILRNSPGAEFILMGAGGFLVIILAGFIFISLPSALNKNYKAALTNAYEVKQSVDFLVFLKENHPDKLVKADLERLCLPKEALAADGTVKGLDTTIF